MAQTLNILYLNNSVVTMEYAFVKFIELTMCISMEVKSYLIFNIKKWTDNKYNSLRRSAYLLLPLRSKWAMLNSGTNVY